MVDYFEYEMGRFHMGCTISVNLFLCIYWMQEFLELKGLLKSYCIFFLYLYFCSVDQTQTLAHGMQTLYH